MTPRIRCLLTHVVRVLTQIPYYYFQWCNWLGRTSRIISMHCFLTVHCLLSWVSKWLRGSKVCTKPILAAIQESEVGLGSCITMKTVLPRSYGIGTLPDSAIWTKDVGESIELAFVVQFLRHYPKYDSLSEIQGFHCASYPRNDRSQFFSHNVYKHTYLNTYDWLAFLRKPRFLLLTRSCFCRGITSYLQFVSRHWSTAVINLYSLSIPLLVVELSLRGIQCSPSTWSDPRIGSDGTRVNYSATCSYRCLKVASFVVLPDWPCSAISLRRSRIEGSRNGWGMLLEEKWEPSISIRIVERTMLSILAYIWCLWPVRGLSLFRLSMASTRYRIRPSLMAE
jgi:hypothetical protein